MKTKTIALSIFSIIASLTIMTGTVFGVAENGVEMECENTIAGLPMEISVNTLKNVDLSMMLTSPTGKTISFDETSDKNGKIRMEIPEYHTLRAGEYSLSARVSESAGEMQNACSFSVFPGELSVTKSLIETDRKTAEAGSFENIVAHVKLVDNYLNPIKGHTVKLLSSRAEDEVQLLSSLPYTDDEGTISFLVRSEEEGMSSLSALDLTEDMTISARARIAFLSADKKALGGENIELPSYSYGNYYDDASIFLSSVGEPGTLYEFVIDMDGNIKKSNESMSATVSAVDELGNTVPNYMGTIRFSSTDDNAILPEDYTFTTDDLGVHEFSLGVTFKSQGTHILSVNDTTNIELKGELELEVAPGVPSAPAVQTIIKITSPAEGIYKSDTIKLSGTALPDTSLQVLEGTARIAEIKSDTNGNFETSLSTLKDGAHVLYVAALNADGQIVSESDRIAFSLDNTPPLMTSFTMEPLTDIEPGSEVQAKLVSEAGLSEVTILINNRSVELAEVLGEEGTYTGTFNADSTPGTYTVDLILKDNVGNETGLLKQTEFAVKALVSLPTQVTEITAVPSDQKVTLTWAAAEDNTYITAYKISYGFNPEGLYLETTTRDSSTTWYVPNLENDQTYYFGMQAIDSEGNAGPMSELLSAIPLAPAGALPASLGEPIVLEELPSATPNTGPEVWFFILASFIIVDIVYRAKGAVK